MITGLIHVARPADPEAIERLADTLSALVEGVAAGLVADAVIVAGEPSEALTTVAEASGAALVLRARGASPWQAGAAVARRDWVLCLEAGDLPREGWIRSVDRFVGTAGSDTTMGRLRRFGAGPGRRLTDRAERFLGVGRPQAGDLLRRERLLAGLPFRPRLRPRLLSAAVERA